MQDANSESATRPVFQEGDHVVLAQGMYRGTLGVFLRLQDDTRWADIIERGGRIRSHPLEWLARAVTATAAGDDSANGRGSI